MIDDFMTGERFAGRVAAVTGAASGIGRATALRFLAEGAYVVFADVNEAALQDILDDLTRPENGGPEYSRPEYSRPEYSRAEAASRARIMRCDVSDETDFLRLRRFIAKEFGQLDVMVNSAGISGALEGLIHLRVQDWDRTIAVILRGVFLGIKHAALMMRRQPEGGSIINISSVAALCGSAGGAAYSAAKAGVVSLTQTSAIEFARSKVRVNAISPGWVLTPMVVLGDPDEVRRAALDSQPLPSPAEPEDIAGIAAFLASADARYITGANIVADGGSMAEGPGFYTGRNPLGNHIVEHFRAAGIRHIDVKT